MPQVAKSKRGDLHKVEDVLHEVGPTHPAPKVGISQFSVITKRGPAVIPANIDDTFTICQALFKELLYNSAPQFHNYSLG